MTMRDFRLCTDGDLLAPWHIRSTSVVEPFRSGDADTPSLCGALPIGRAQDQSDHCYPVTRGLVNGLRTISAVCPRCADLYAVEAP